ncbi:double-strand break repair helicase AddA [Altererythrobacter sp. KTW20L]|uniref:double-strand break repair helicase AddA n=1 Tax=Altererythrobacter sp. KTW20L TaxID=2942210 RepID=UPI0020C084FE|nr:double-strand break repair helicase AddA [Altererythrobacter sp. KTW20L]MCL6251366.1 double-strand break repair helicase AddA [Altererythrobacter sp. KTW20L]
MSGQKVFPLSDEQLGAVDPRDSVWLSASAGTGKTQVLSARVLRLLLRPDVRPEQILCLTFTKAGAAEMAARVSEVLASWVRMDDAVLGGDLLMIGADNDPDTRSRARTLFAAVLDCPGGGLRIDTIHAFAQWLLAAFPGEAGLEPGSRPMEDRDRDLLASRVLSDLLVEWQETGDRAAIEAIELLSLRLGPDGARGWLVRCAAAREAWMGPGAFAPPMRPLIENLLGIEEGMTRATLAEWCSDDVLDQTPLRQIADTYHAWGTKSGAPYPQAIAQWLALAAEDRLARCVALRDALFNKGGVLKYLKNIEKIDPGIGSVGDDLAASFASLLEHKARFDMADLITPALEVGRKYALAWDEAKRREGLLDFDDLIRSAAQLLAEPGQGDWIRYKLDRQFDHVLVDEAQDTNQAQWSIIDALTGDFFAGLGQRDEKLRTLFVVGDYKQAIFRFQGTSPENFARARDRYRQLMLDRARNAAMVQATFEARELVELPLGRSYRTAQDVLDFVDDAVRSIGPQMLGLSDEYEQHVGDSKRPGLVRLWQPVSATPDEPDEDAELDPADAETWISAPERRMADRIAAQVKHWMEHGFPLVKGGARNAGPGDVMVLVRKRRELAGLIVARLHAAGVPVAGVDRLRLGAPLAVKDLMAALRFAAQPADSLNLAALLVSPVFGWSQQDLLDHAYREKVTLWDHLRSHRNHPLVGEAVDKLLGLLAIADFEPPQALLHWMLVGPWQARRKLTARLGSDANDPIDELLNAALAFSAAHVPSLQGFIQWFDAGDGELKREAGEGGGQVRVMTVHGSKGLQAPIVILADATGNPHRPLVSASELPPPEWRGGPPMPLPSLRKAEKSPAVIEADAAEQAAQLAEHWRLLYVAMTRAEEALFIGGALGKREKECHADSWYARLAPLFPDLSEHDDIWAARRERGSQADPILKVNAEQQGARMELPRWAITPIGPEPRPPRPLAPSSAADEQGADPPLPSDASALAARRGVLMHSLLERLPDVASDQREERGGAWLVRMAADFSNGERADMLARAMAVIADPQWAELFGPDAMAEVPLAATVAGQVIAGTADRLLVDDTRVLVADFKTARRPPSSLGELPASTLRQMGAYAAALEVIFPGRRVEAVLLYTQTPLLIAIPPELLAANKPRLAPVE